jgi:hypothetical protein
MPPEIHLLLPDFIGMVQQTLPTRHGFCQALYRLQQGLMMTKMSTIHIPLLPCYKLLIINNLSIEDSVPARQPRDVPLGLRPKLRNRSSGGMQTPYCRIAVAAERFLHVLNYC